MLSAKYEICLVIRFGFVSFAMKMQGRIQRTHCGVATVGQIGRMLKVMK